MPLYEYECKKCHHRFEHIQKSYDPHMNTCTECDVAVEKVLPAHSEHFKGSGWYVTDYARGSSKAGTSKDGESGGKKEETSTKEDKPKPDSSKSESSESKE